MKNEAFSPMSIVFSRAKRIVNAHAHLDRAYTLTPELFEAYEHLTLKDKWSYIDRLKREQTEEDYSKRILAAARRQAEEGVSILVTFVDADPIVQLKAVHAARHAQRVLAGEGVTLLIANQALKGVINLEAWRVYQEAAKLVDILGGLPGYDEHHYNQGAEHVTRILRLAKKLGKPVHFHADQFNQPEERESELIAELTMQEGMQGRVAIIHGISLAAKPKAERERAYRKLRDAGIGVIACPYAWIDTPRSEQLMPFHNALTPVDELLAWQIPVGIGTDNIQDLMLPYSTGSLREELHLLASGVRLSRMDDLVRILEARGVPGIPEA